MPEPMTPQSGFGKVLTDTLRSVLSVPENAVSFSVHFTVHDIIKVDCNYMPVDPVLDGKHIDITSLGDAFERAYPKP